MSLKAVPASWFELLTKQTELTSVLGCLSRTGSVQLESRSELERHWQGQLEESLASYRNLRRTYEPYWPPPTSRLQSGGTLGPVEMLGAAMRSLEAWVEQAAPLVAEMEALDQQHDRLEMLHELIEGGKDDLPDLHRFSQAGPVLERLCLVVPEEWVGDAPPSTLVKRVFVDHRTYVLALGARHAVHLLRDQVTQRGAHTLELPDWLPRDLAAARASLRRRQETIASEVSSLHARVEKINRTLGLAGVISDLEALEWFEKHVPSFPSTETLAWVTGWTSDLDCGRLRKTLEQSSVRALVRPVQPPRALVPPMVLVNPVWARPFELFTRLFGVPGVADVDPSCVVAFIAPVLFGYMFGDVGQGLVLTVTGMLFRRQIPALAILIPGGLMSIVFGVLFGSVFGREDLIPALWLHPLEEPVTLLLGALLIGSAVIAAGLVLNIVQSYGRADSPRSWRAPVALSVLYVSVLSGFIVDVRLAWLALPSVTWYLFEMAHAAPAGARADGLRAGLSELLEAAGQLFINTLSFVRVGAFALAHAGLGIAMVVMAQAAEAALASLLVMVVGNGIIILLEGLIVSIQTTRLLLFEFFIRFFRFGGRPFVPLPQIG